MKIGDIQERPDKLINAKAILDATLAEYSTPDYPLYGNLFAYYASDIEGSDLNRLYIVVGRDPAYAGPEWPKGLDPVVAARREDENPQLFFTQVSVFDLTDVEEELTLSGGLVNWAATSAVLHRIYTDFGHGAKIPEVIRRSEVEYLAEHEAAIKAPSTPDGAVNALKKDMEKFFRLERSNGLRKEWLNFFRSDRYPATKGRLLPLAYFLRRKNPCVSLRHLRGVTEQIHTTVMAEREYQEFAQLVRKEHPELTYAVDRPYTRDEGLDKKGQPTVTPGVRRVTEDEYTAIKEKKFALMGFDCLAGVKPAKWTTRKVYYKAADDALVAGIYQRIRFRFAKPMSLKELRGLGELIAYDVGTADLDSVVAMLHMGCVPFAIDTAGSVKMPKDGRAHILVPRRRNADMLGIYQHAVNGNICLAHDDPMLSPSDVRQIYGGREPVQIVRLRRVEDNTQDATFEVGATAPALATQIEHAEARAQDRAGERPGRPTPAHGRD